VSNVVAMGLGDSTHGHSFRNILADQTVEVFIAAALPRMIGCCEIALQGETIFNCLIVVELCAVVEGNGLELRVPYGE
jgi:hypothetical protein